jgi:integrase
LYEFHLGDRVPKTTCAPTFAGRPGALGLKTYLDGLPKESLLFVVGSKGRTIDETTFTKEFRAALDAAGLTNLHFHGLRHSAGRALAEAGCSSHEIQSITGHRTLQMVEHYTKAARQKRLATAAIAKLEGTGTERESGKLDV